MTALWRIGGDAGLDGRGAEKASARWHTAGPGKRVVYLSEHPALALVENLVNLQYSAAVWPESYQLIRAETDPKAILPLEPEVRLTNGWRDHIETTRSIGDAWLAEGSSPLLRVPSAAVPESFNYLFNPRHPHADLIKLIWHRRLKYDHRLFRLMPVAGGR